MKFIDIPKNIPKREYLVIDYNASSWSSSKIIGIFEIKIDGDIMIEDECYIPIEIRPIKNNELNDLGVENVLLVIRLSTESIGINSWVASEEFKSYKREKNIDSVLN